MTADPRCEDCDLPRADRVLTAAERAAVPGGGRTDLCWGGCEAIDWRARALAAEARLSSPPAPPATGAVAETVIEEDGNRQWLASRTAEGWIDLRERAGRRLIACVTLSTASLARLLEVMNGGK